jgi:hypothetical protein
MLLDRSEGMSVKEASAKWHLSERHIYQLARGQRPPLSKPNAMSQPARTDDIVQWRHHFIKELQDAGNGCSYIGSVLRMNHTSVLYHMNGACQCDQRGENRHKNGLTQAE